MASTSDYVEYVAERLASTGSVRYKKMFGEYMVYVNDKPLVLVCGNTSFVKILPCLNSLMAKAERGSPYDGAKEHYILDVKDRELAERVIDELDRVVDVPKTNNKKSSHPKPYAIYHCPAGHHENKGQRRKHRPCNGWWRLRSDIQDSELIRNVSRSRQTRAASDG